MHYLKLEKLWSLIDQAADHPRQNLSATELHEMEGLMEEYYDEQVEDLRRAHLDAMLDDGTPTWDVQGRL